MFIMGIYHFILFLYNKSTISTLIFSIMSFEFVVFGLTTYDSLLKNVIYTNFEMFSHSAYFVVSTFPALMALFFYLQYKTEVNKKVMVTIISVAIPLLLFNMFADSYTVRKLLFISAINFLLIFFYLLLAVLPKAIIRKRQGAIWAFIGLLILTIANINDILFGLGYFRTMYLSHFGFSLYIIFQSFNLAERYSFSFRKNLKLNKLLINQNEEFSALNKEYLNQNKELIVAKEKAEEGNKLKTQFLNNMSHEIRTPMNSILGFSELLNNQSLSEEDRKYYRSIINESSNKLLRIIEQILEISSLETKQQKPQIVKTDLNKLLLQIVSSHSIIAKDKGLSVNLNTEQDNNCIIETDKYLLQKALNQLINNAIKFTNSGFIEIGYKILNEKIEFYIKDTGIGIDRKNHEIVFKRFTQEHENIAADYGGLGLGLNIALKNVELLGGTIRLQSEKDKGSVFFITIPYHQTTSDTNIADINYLSEHIKSNKNSYNILIVEDEEMNYIFLETLLLIINPAFVIYKAVNGKEAVNFCKTGKKIDLILMDLKMPVLDGFEATKQIKELCENIPIIAQSAYTNNEDKLKAYESKCDDYLTKPINKTALEVTLSKYIEFNEQQNN